MKRYLAIFIFLFTIVETHAQLFTKEHVKYGVKLDEKRWSWGYFLGFNVYDFNFDYKSYDDNPYRGQDLQVERNIGFNVGLLGNLKLHKNIDLRLQPGVNFNSRSFKPAGYSSSETYREIRSTYVHIPLLLKISTNRVNNFKPFIEGGFSYSINLASNEDSPDDNSNGQFRMTTHNYYYELGIGIDFYLYYFKFSPSIRGVFGLNDELVRDNNPNSIYTGNVAKMTSNAVFINFTFQ
ncbi:porin family protein [Zunongwangia sp.]|uniref:type IX secretion/gliding motility protein PorT/SprT n=1 Tax=Zunongwangia sp. TaxID=1965325 RepID=UPI003AA7B7FE